MNIINSASKDDFAVRQLHGKILKQFIKLTDFLYIFLKLFSISLGLSVFSRLSIISCFFISSSFSRLLSSSCFSRCRSWASFTLRRLYFCCNFWWCFFILEIFAWSKLSSPTKQLIKTPPEVFRLGALDFSSILDSFLVSVLIGKPPSNCIFSVLVK